MRPAILAGGLFVAAIAVALLVVYSGLGAPAPTPSPSGSPSAVASSPQPSQSASPRPTASGTPRPSPSSSPIDTSVRAAAVVVPQRSTELALPVSGIVGGVYVREGEEVLANRILLRLDQKTEVAALDVATSGLQRAEAELDRAQLAVDQLPPDATPAAIEAAQAELRVAQTDLDLARASLAEAQVAIEQTELRAPFAATIASVSVELGEQATAGEPLVAMGDMTAWLVETTDLSELEVVRISVGAPASMTFTALPDLVLSGRVERIQVRGTTETGGVRFAVSIRPDVHLTELRWGMSAEVRISPSG